MAASDDYADFLERLTDGHQRRLADVLQTLENNIASFINTAPDRAGKLFDLEWSIQARQEIRRQIDSSFLGEAQSIIDGYMDVANEQFEMLSQYGTFTRVAPETIQALQQLSFQGFQAIADQQLDTLATGIYQSTLTGRSKDELIKELRGQINGVYQQSDDEQARQLVEIAQTATGKRQKDAIDKLHSIYARDRLGNNLRRYATQMANDRLAQYSASLTRSTANEAGITNFQYYGDVIADSREFCINNVGKVFTEEEIQRKWEGSWAGKAPGDPFIVRGGYNCRHHWLPIVEPEEPEVEEEEPRERKAFPKADTGLPKQWNDLANSDGGIRPEAVTMINAYDKPEIVSSRGKQGAFYQSNLKKITTYKRNKSVMLHEYGHHIDFTATGSISQTISESFFPDAAKSDAKKLGVFQLFDEKTSPYMKMKARDAAVVNRVKQLKEELLEQVDYIPKTGKYKGMVRGTTTQPRFPGADLISDIIDSMSQGAMYDEARGFGHGGAYYMGRNAIQMQQTENFANLFSLWAQDNEGWEKAQELFPELTEEFLSIVGEFG